MGKLGSATAFAAEAALWISGAALIASAAGMQWTVHLPKVDLSGILAAKSAAPATPRPPMTPFPSNMPVDQKLQAFFGNQDLQFEIHESSSLKSQSQQGSSTGAVTITSDYKAGDVSRVIHTKIGAKTTSSGYVALGSKLFKQDNNSAWTTETRPQGYTRELTMLWESRQFSDKGLEKKNGQSLHRIEASDKAALSSEFQQVEDFSNAKMALVYWTDDAGKPAFFSFSGTYTQVSNGVSWSMQLTDDGTFVKTSGVTITAPI